MGEEIHAPSFSRELPLLSKDMYFSQQEFMPSTNNEKHQCRVLEGMELLFVYDLGSTTFLGLTIESIAPMPVGRVAADYPRPKDDPRAGENERKRQRCSQAPLDGLSLDKAFPRLCTTLLATGVRLDIGKGNGCDGSPWLTIWGGGGEYPGYQSSVLVEDVFPDMDELWHTLERGIAKQTGPGFPEHRVLKKIQRPNGEIYEECNDDGPDRTRISVHCQAYCSTTPTSEYRPEMTKCPFSSGSHEYGLPKGDIVIESWSTWCFNFALPRDWRSAPDLPNCSFVKCFPKCALWLTHPSKIAFWMSCERGVLSAMKGKFKFGVGPNVVHKTLKHNSVHAMFADMESQIELSKSWKFKG